MVEPEQLSSKAAGLNSVPTAVYVHTPELVLLVCGPTQLIVGNSLSFTVTVNEQVLVLLLASVTVHTTVVVPLWKIAPARVELALKLLLMVEPVQLSSKAAGLNSVPTAVYVHTPELALLVCGKTQLMVGNSLSLTVIVNEQVLVLLLASVTVHITVEVPLGKIAPARVEPAL
jgi:hypothetical protein